MKKKTIGPFQMEWDNDFRIPIYQYRRGRITVSLCREDMDEWFYIDPDKPFWLEIHNRPGKERVAYRRTYDREWDAFDFELQLRGGRWVRHYLLFDAEFYMRKNIPGKGHIALVQ